MARKGGNPDIAKKGFKKGDPKINRNGRPPKLITELCRQTGYKPSQIQGLYDEMVFLKKPELEAMASNNELPAIQLLIAKTILTAMEKGDIKHAEFILPIKEQRIKIDSTDTLKIEFIENKPAK